MSTFSSTKNVTGSNVMSRQTNVYTKTVVFCCIYKYSFHDFLFLFLRKLQTIHAVAWFSNLIKDLISQVGDSTFHHIYSNLLFYRLNRSYLLSNFKKLCALLQKKKTEKIIQLLDPNIFVTNIL